MSTKDIQKAMKTELSPFETRLKAEIQQLKIGDTLPAMFALALKNITKDGLKEIRSEVLTHQEHGLNEVKTLFREAVSAESATHLQRMEKDVGGIMNSVTEEVAKHLRLVFPAMDAATLQTLAEGGLEKYFSTPAFTQLIQSHLDMVMPSFDLKPLVDKEVAGLVPAFKKQCGLSLGEILPACSTDLVKEVLEM